MAYIKKGSKYKPVVNDLWSSKKHVPMCYDTHPPLEFGGLTVYGGSCSHPMVKDADVYIGFDYNVSGGTPRFPWEGPMPVIIRYPVSDGSAPADPESFRKMVDWTLDQLKQGKKVHVGCIGGHGRTGTFLAALVAVHTGNTKAVEYVRENYCKSAVESTSQVNFLVKHYDQEEVASSKKYSWDTGPTR